MKNLFACCFFFLAGIAQAATVSLDFNEIPSGSIPFTPFGYIVESKGYTFTITGNLNGGASDVYAGPGGIGAYSEPRTFGPYVDMELLMERADGGAFALFSAGTLQSSSSGGIVGELLGGGAADLATPIGTGDWLKLQNLRLVATAQFFEFDEFGEVSVKLDDLVVSATAVPVPAAVWLFGSGLGLLGWLRRRKMLKEI